MAGTDPTFVASDFRTSIRFAMAMGMPTADGEKLKWYFNTVKTYSHHDPSALPYDWTASPTSDTKEDPSDPDVPTIVDYALEFGAGSSTDTEVGRFDTSHLVVTLLDQDWVVVQGADYAMIGDTVYDVQFVGPPLGMFDVTVYQVYLKARDQS